MARGVASSRRGRFIERRSSFGSEPAAARAGRDGSERVAGAGRVRRRSARARGDSEGSVEPSEPVGEDGDANVRCAGTRTVRRDPSAQSHASEIVQRHRRRRVRTAEVIRGADVEGVRGRGRAKRGPGGWTRVARYAERRPSPRGQYDTSMERWTTRARVGDDFRRARKRHYSVFHSDWNGEGCRRGTRAVLAPFDSTAHRPSSKSARLASFVSALLRRREKKTTTTKTETRPRRD